jgi:hypothetical protein
LFPELAIPVQLCWKKETSMRKKERKDQEQQRKPRRLSLFRETILVLEDPSLLEQARGGTTQAHRLTCGTTSLVTSIEG